MLPTSSKTFTVALCISLASAILTTGCAPMIIGGAVVAGSVAVDRRTAGAQVDDQAIEIKVRTALNEHIAEGSHVNINSYNRQVLLTGEVATEADRQKAAEQTRQVENVRNVYNELQVMPSTGYSQRSSDTYITGKVRTRIINTENLPSKSLKITTERGVVYLQGLVTPREAELATEVARTTDGVARVVRLFEYISETELAQSQADREARTPTEPIAP
ncbi:BON domain-containing protein [Corticibacter populi]|uniref:BON domain-containing protein n=1 Tax=Corticibacter populi TaxID=1550736 RepID=A0A3M6QPM7_9BURK|nr:BON domain-containing protein [Corticibacter populi]RMX04975.1 BON domain-containing protein [Corticibacter populi]RZS33596.1 osmotically-inducible protein OsmY [Corticibacter populi]